MSHTQSQPPAGWYPDPAGSGHERYWDGANWSQVTRPTPGPPMAHQGNQYGYQPTGGYGTATAARMGPARLAGWWWRVLAAIIDGFVLWIPSALLQNVFAGDALVELQLWLEELLVAAELGRTDPPPLPDSVTGAFMAAGIATAVLYIVYRTVLVALAGGTAGQLATGLRVVRDGDHSLGKVSWGTSALRALLAVVFQNIPVVNLVNVLMPLFTPKKQTFHDMVAKTVVVKK